MDTNRYWLTITGVALCALALWLYNSPAHASTQYKIHEDSSIEVTCTGSQVDLVVAECKAEFVRICPYGGVVLDATGSPVDAQPLILTAIIKCNPNPAI